MMAINKNIGKYLQSHTSIAPLVVLRVLFGFIMFLSILRFAWKGWITDLYIKPAYFFTYYGLEWIQPLPGWAMYLLFVLMAIAAVFVMLGLFYRPSILFFFISFTYVELIDKSNYLNHYYFVSLISFLLVLVPANRYFSLDVLRRPEIFSRVVSLWCIDIFKLQLAIVYFYAGIAKLNTDWLIEALPLKMWLAPHTELPLIGEIFKYSFTAYVFSWFGALYDISIPFLLWLRKTRKYAYSAVIIFHLITWILFPIGMFPWIMMLMTLIFFSPSFHQKLIDHLSFYKNTFRHYNLEESFGKSKKLIFAKASLMILVIFFTFQLLIPWRYLLYPGNIFWNEQGYRFSWRVMLMEKAGYTIFHIRDGATGKETEVYAHDYLTPWQEKQMATQPDMILQFAQFLDGEYTIKGMKEPEVYVDSYVSLNGKGSRRMIDASVDLSQQPLDLKHRNWIIPWRNSSKYLTVGQ